MVGGHGRRIDLKKKKAAGRGKVGRFRAGASAGLQAT